MIMHFLTFEQQSSRLKTHLFLSTVLRNDPDICALRAAQKVKQFSAAATDAAGRRTAQNHEHVLNANSPDFVFGVGTFH